MNLSLFEKLVINSSNYCLFRQIMFLNRIFILQSKLINLIIVVEEHKICLYIKIVEITLDKFERRYRLFRIIGMENSFTNSFRLIRECIMIEKIKFDGSTFGNLIYIDTRAHLRISLTTWNKWNTVDTVNENQL